MIHQRPTGVTILALWYFVNGVASFAAGLAPLFLNFLPSTLGAITLIPIAIGIIGVVFGAFYFALGWGLWEGHGWGRIGATVLSALALVSYLFSAVVSILALNLLGPGIALLILATLQGLIIYYLMRVEVEEFFTPLPTPPPRQIISSPPPRLTPIPASQSVFSMPARTPVTASESPMPRIPRTELSNVAPPATAWLVARNGVRMGKEFGLQRERNRVGRDSAQCDIILDDGTVSKLHAEVKYENGRFVLYDLASTNGSYVNNYRVQRQALLDGDDIRLGNALFVFKEVRARNSH